ncbi:hypothetical protein EOM60_03550 [Candidatus Saccharibacteria bacterium]|nr:hypothetical protein [Candidatus Saccharibacteria bacterium]
MQDLQTVIVLLTVIVTLLSVGNLVLLGVIIALLLKIRGIANQAEKAMSNISRVTEWFSPAKVYEEIANLFKNKGGKEQ